MILRDPRGFTLPEVLLTVAVIGIGLAAIMSVIPVGAYGVQEGKQLSTATFLADQRLEQMRNLPWVTEPAGFPNDALPANDCLGLSPDATSGPRVPGPTPCFNQTASPSVTLAAVGAKVPPCVFLPNNVDLASARPCFDDEDATGTDATGIPRFAGYSRTVRVDNCLGAAAACSGVNDAAMRLVTVTVTYNPLTGAGVSPAPKSVRVTMVIAKR
jgi:prepilin-type N-terminal cleavage/methylation domain-containing protein